MYQELNGFTLDQIQLASQGLKDSFKATENKIWDPSTFASELVFQSTHLFNAVINKLRLQDSQFIGPLSGVNKGIEDESADVLFNFMNLANAFGISVSESLNLITPEEQENLFRCSEPLVLCANLAIQSGELWDSIFRNDGYKHMTRTREQNIGYIKRAFAGSLVAFFAISNYLGVDLYQAFQEMHKDASLFLDQYKVL